MRLAALLPPRSRRCGSRRKHDPTSGCSQPLLPPPSIPHPHVQVAEAMWMTSATLGKGRAERTVSNAKQGAFEQTFCGLCKSVCRRGPEMQMTEAKIDVRAQRVYCKAQNDLTQERHRTRRRKLVESHADGCHPIRPCDGRAATRRGSFRMACCMANADIGPNADRGHEAWSKVQTRCVGASETIFSDVKVQRQAWEKRKQEHLDKPRAGFGWTLFGALAQANVSECAAASRYLSRNLSTFFGRTRPYSRWPRSSSRSCRGERVVHRIGSPDTDVTDDKKPPVSA